MDRHRENLNKRKGNLEILGREFVTFCHNLNTLDVAIENATKLYANDKFYYSQPGTLLGVARLKFPNEGLLRRNPASYRPRQIIFRCAMPASSKTGPIP